MPNECSIDKTMRFSTLVFFKKLGGLYLLSTNDKIKYVAFKLFLEKGYEATNIREICREVGIKPSSLYFYFKSKQELFFRIYDEVWEDKIRFIESIEDLKQDIPPDIKLYTLFKSIIEYCSKDISKQKFLLRSPLHPKGVNECLAGQI